MPIEVPNDAIVWIITNIYGSDLHMYEGRTPAEPGFIPNHARQTRGVSRVMTVTKRRNL